MAKNNLTLVPLSIQVFDGRDVYQPARYRQPEVIDQAEFDRRFPAGVTRSLEVAVAGNGLDAWFVVIPNYPPEGGDLCQT